MGSNDEDFLWINGLTICNDRSEKDIALLRENLFEGMEIHQHYP